MLRKLQLTASIIFSCVFISVCIWWARGWVRQDAFNAKLSANRVLHAEVREGNFSCEVLTYQRTPAKSVDWLWLSGPVVQSGLAWWQKYKLGFACWSGWNGDIFRRHLAFPQWFAVTVTGLLALAFHPRPWRRFTLRSLFLATTVVALVLGIFTLVDRSSAEAMKQLRRESERRMLASEIDGRVFFVRNRLPNRFSHVQGYDISEAIKSMAGSGDERPLITLISRLEELGYDFRGADVERMKSLAATLDEHTLPELLELFDQAFAPERSAPN